MTDILSGEKLRKAIQLVSAGKKVACAVAFWGIGAENIIGDPKFRQVRLICNLKMGGTNPDALKLLIDSGAEVRQIDRLHAKIYIGYQNAIVTSSNASINGLGIEGDDLKGWIEAGISIAASDVLPWFEHLWKDGRKIEPKDLQQARKKYRGRTIVQPSRGTFAHFFPTNKNYPLIDWSGDMDRKLNKKSIQTSVGRVDERIIDRIDTGFEVLNDADVELYPAGQWVLRWEPKNDGFPSRTHRPWWSCSSGIYIPNAYTVGLSASRGCVLSMEIEPPKPFDESEPRFRRAFLDVLSRDKFSKLRDLDFEGDFFRPRLYLMWDFWGDLREAYDNAAAN